MLCPYIYKHTWKSTGCSNSAIICASSREPTDGTVSLLANAGNIARRVSWSGSAILGHIVRAGKKQEQSNKQMHDDKDKNGTWGVEIAALATAGVIHPARLLCAPRSS
jgi:hypothetical protein